MSYVITSVSLSVYIVKVETDILDHDRVHIMVHLSNPCEFCIVLLSGAVVIVTFPWNFANSRTQEVL